MFQTSHLQAKSNEAHFDELVEPHTSRNSDAFLLIGIISLQIGTPTCADDRDSMRCVGDLNPEVSLPDLKPEVGYGTLRGQFILDGDLPELQPAGVPTDANGGDIKLCGASRVIRSVSEGVLYRPRSRVGLPSTLPACTICLSHRA
jgi:hypothetical protein